MHAILGNPYSPMGARLVRALGIGAGLVERAQDGRRQRRYLGEYGSMRSFVRHVHGAWRASVHLNDRSRPARINFGIEFSSEEERLLEFQPFHRTDEGEWPVASRPNSELAVALTDVNSIPRVFEPRVLNRLRDAPDQPGAKEPGGASLGVREISQHRDRKVVTEPVLATGGSIAVPFLENPIRPRVLIVREHSDDLEHAFSRASSPHASRLSSERRLVHRSWRLARERPALSPITA